MSKKQAKLIRKSLKVCPLLAAMYGKLLGEGYRGIEHRAKSRELRVVNGKKITRGPITIITTGKRQVYQKAKVLLYEKV
jgi:hypothetical protein